MSEALQFGALGVLTLVLMGIGAGVLWYIKETVAQQKESNAKLWQMVDATQKAADAQVVAWGQSMQKVITILDTIHVGLKDHENAMEDRHVREMEAICRGK